MSLPYPSAMAGSAASAGNGVRHRRRHWQHLFGLLVSIVVAAVSFVIALVFSGDEGPQHQTMQ